jgi:chaperonin GroES
MPLRLIPLANHVLLRREAAETLTSSGLHIPESARTRPQRAKVEAVGPGKRGKDGAHIPMDVLVGDTVLMARWVGSEIPGEPDLLIVREEDVLAVVVEDPIHDEDATDSIIGSP